MNALSRPHTDNLSDTVIPKILIELTTPNYPISTFCRCLSNICYGLT